MCQFIETICYEHGHFQRIGLHNERCNRTRNHFFGKQPDLQLELFLSVPDHLREKTVKCTVTYGIEILSIEYILYEIRPVKSLQLVRNDTIGYAYKYADRTQLNSLFQLRGQCDDILIVKNGLVTDTSYANSIYLCNNVWYSQQIPLLQGTRLKSYLLERRVTPALIRPGDLSLFSEARIINAMISIENAPVIQIRNIKRLIHF
jgi:4-amino-4-deoxychorismate lyase